MRQAREYKSRMFEASNIYSDFFQMLAQAIPILSKETAKQKSSSKEVGQALEEIQRQVDILSNAYQELNSSLPINETALGHLQEGQEIGKGLARELADLATLSQYVEIAAQSSANFNRDILGLVDLPVFEEALRGLKRERLADIVGVIDRVRGNSHSE